MRGVSFFRGQKEKKKFEKKKKKLGKKNHLTVVEPPSDDVDRRRPRPRPQKHGKRLWALAHDPRLVLHPIQHERRVELRQRQLGRRQLPLLEVAEVLARHGRDLVEAAQQRARDDRQVPRGLLGPDVPRDARVEPARVDLVPHEVRGLDHLGGVVHDRANLAADLDLLEGHHHRADRRLARLALGKQVAKLRVRKLVDAAARLDREVAPDLGAGAERQLVDVAARRLEPVVGVLARHAHRDDVAQRGHLLVLLKVDRVDAGRVLAVHAAHVRDAVQRHAHADQQLAGGDVDPGDPLGDRVLDLQARVELEEEELAGAQRVEVLNGRGADVADRPGQRARAPLHLAERLRGGLGHGALLHDLLVAALDGAVARVDRRHVPVRVGEQLHLEVARRRRQLHRKDRRAGHLALDGPEDGAHLLVGAGLADPLAPAAPRRLEHDGVADAVAGLDGLVDRVQAGRVVDVGRDDARAAREVDGDARARPGDGGHAGGLRDDRRADLVPEGGHRGGGGAEEPDAGGGLGQGRRELGLLRGVAPPETEREGRERGRREKRGEHFPRGRRENGEEKRFAPKKVERKE